MTVPAGQREAAALCARLCDGAAPIETHISAVFVGRERALKLKKAVDLGFLDFSTVAARERFCRRELEINAPAAPELYRAVHPIARDAAGALVLGGDGPAEDWVLEMAPLPPEAFLEAVLARGAPEPALLDGLGDLAAALHAAAPVAPAPDVPASLRARVAADLRSARAVRMPEAQLEQLGAALDTTIARLAPALQARGEAGFVRRCHGDLHPGNIVLWRGAPVAFDALEFDEAMATIDVGYDLAFLLMELDQRVGRAAANRVLGRTVARSGDLGLLAGLPLWLALRALVRAHIRTRLGGDGLPYLTAAEDYLRPVPPRLVAVGGVQGTGKTRLARTLAPGLGAAPGALVLRSDEIRKRLAGVPPEQRLLPDSYTPERSAAVYAAFLEEARAALRAGHSVVADAVFLDPALRDGMAAVAREAGVPFQGFWLEAPPAVLHARVAGRQRDASDADAAVLEATLRRDPGPLRWHRLDAASDPVPGALALLPPPMC
ncbi:AAA family ATPase [Roseomonas sp. BN140053]|uniref:bifunctional aminoglycoside phosphotransferase/ATP-binding protein n=1 Tax=Roseomonas sp. BN140053 TaxID=3391898 RepID=UPI0039E7F1C3